MRRSELFPGFFPLGPFHMRRRLSEEMDRVFGGRDWGGTGGWMPPIEVRQEGNVKVTGEGLLIQGERKRQHEEHREGYYRSERSRSRAAGGAEAP